MSSLKNKGYAISGVATLDIAQLNCKNTNRIKDMSRQCR